jgi:hypothetical protein
MKILNDENLGYWFTGNILSSECTKCLFSVKVVPNARYPIYRGKITYLQIQIKLEDGKVINYNSAEDKIVPDEIFPFYLEILEKYN